LFLAETNGSTTMRRLLILILAVYGVTAALFWVTAVNTATLYAVKDSYSWQSVPKANNGGSNNFAITSSTANPMNMRGWIAFDMRGVPNDVWILNAELRLRVWHKTTTDPKLGIGDSTGRVYGVYRLTQPWTEFNITWAYQPNYTEEHHATSPVPPGQGGWDGPLLYMDWDVTALVRDWASGADNYGILIRDTQENAPLYYSTQFFTHNKVPNESYFPRLLVTYVNPLSVVILVAALGLEGLLITTLWRMRKRRQDTSEHR